MPEGHTLHRLARAVGEAFRGDVVTATSPQGRFADGAALLDGLAVRRADAHGKHLLVAFGGDDAGRATRWLHVHLGLYGKTAFGALGTDDDGAPPAPVGQVRLRLVGPVGPGQRWMDLRGPTACEVVTPAEVAALRARLGPDPLRRDEGPERFLARAGASRVSIGALLMHQDVLAGAGNIYRAEVLFRAGLSPFTEGRDVDPAVLLTLWDDLRVLMRDGVRTGRIVTTRHADRRSRAALAVDRLDGSPVRPGQEGSHYVYRRTGLPCRRCATPVATAVVEARNLYWCPTCQPV